MLVGCQPQAPAAFTPTDIPGTHFHEGLSRPQGHGLVGRKYITEKSSDTTENRSRDLNHYATPGPNIRYSYEKYSASLQQCLRFSVQVRILVTV
jgi:hypothetical protein